MALGAEESQAPPAACRLRVLLRSCLPTPPRAARLSRSSLWLARRTDSDGFVSVRAGAAPVWWQWVWARLRPPQRKDTLFSSLKTWAFHEGATPKWTGTRAHTIMPTIKNVITWD